MSVYIKNIFCIVILFCSFGCASTVKYNNSLTKNAISQNNATIKVSRSSSYIGGAIACGISDGTTKIGELGPGGELVWSRPPGYIALITGRYSFSPTHVIIFPVKAGKTYELSTSVIWGARFSSAPDNFSKDIIVYEMLAESSSDEIPDTWKSELKKLDPPQ